MARLSEREKRQQQREFVQVRAGAKRWLEKQKRAAYSRGYQACVSGRKYFDIYAYFSPELGQACSQSYKQGWLDAGEEI